MTILIDLFCLVLINRWGQWPCMPMPQRLRCFVRFQWKISSLSSDVFDNTNGMSNVKRLDQKCWLVDNVKFASGQRSCCQKRRLLKLDRSTLFRHTNLIQIMLISIRGVLANCYNFKTNLRNCLQHERPCCIEYIITSRRRVIIYSIQHGRECCKQLVK